MIDLILAGLTSATTERQICRRDFPSISLSQIRSATRVTPLRAGAQLQGHRSRRTRSTNRGPRFGRGSEKLGSLSSDLEWYPDCRAFCVQ
jgi:hypothetical protein